MPRSKDPRNYSKMYHDLAILMDAEQLEIKIETTGANCLHIRGTFYGFINAWKDQIDKVPRSRVLTQEAKDLKVEYALHMEEILRKYLTVIDQPGGLDLATLRDAPHATLRFIYRDMDTRQLDVHDQINAQIDSANALEVIALRRERQREAISKLSGAKIGTPTSSELRNNPATASLFAPVHVEAEDAPPDSAPVDPTDITDLLPSSNEAVKPTTSLRDEALKSSEKLREQEKKLI